MALSTSSLDDYLSALCALDGTHMGSNKIQTCCGACHSDLMWHISIHIAQIYCKQTCYNTLDVFTYLQVTFTRRLYAQLLRERFQAPRNAGFHHYGSSTAYDLGIKLVSNILLVFPFISCVPDMRV